MDLIAEGNARPEGRDPRHARADQGLSAAGRLRGQGAFIDRPFNCIDVCLVMDVARMSPRHKAIYTRGRGRRGRGEPDLERPAPPPPPVLGARDWLRVLRRGAGILRGAADLLPAPAAPAPAGTCDLGAGAARHAVDHARGLRLVLLVHGPGRDVSGVPMRGEGAYVANHSSWLDILVLNASKRMYFVAKAEVAGWGGIGWLARGTGTVFVRRDRAEAAKQAALFERGCTRATGCCSFPKAPRPTGCASCRSARRSFAAFFADGLRDSLQVQPVSVVYPRRRGRRRPSTAGGGQYCVGRPACLSVLGCANRGGYG
jgi:hypothetical protein